MTMRRITLLFSMLACYASLSLQAQTPTLLQSLAGNWQLVAANNGVYEPPVWKSTTDYIDFTATVSSDGTALDCHTDCLYNRSGTTYPADWKMVVEEDGSGKYRIGMVLDDQHPASTVEFQEARDKYADQGYWYWGGSEGGHRYIYLLSDKLEQEGLYAMTFWSEWSTAETLTFSISNVDHQARQIYAVVCESEPYSEAAKVGYFEIWASPKLQRMTDTAITSIGHPADSGTSTVFDLQGRRVSGQPRSGLYIISSPRYTRGAVVRLP